MNGNAIGEQHTEVFEGTGGRARVGWLVGLLVLVGCQLVGWCTPDMVEYCMPRHPQDYCRLITFSRPCLFL